MKRNCDGCTKCCDGSLMGSAYGHTFGPGKPCYFVILNKGCTIYENRPKPQCTDFLCSWIENYEVPDWLKPNLSDTISMTVTWEGVTQLHVTKSGSRFKEEYLEWYKEFAKKNNLNISWDVDGEIGWQGSEELEKAIKKYYHL